MLVIPRVSVLVAGVVVADPVGLLLVVVALGGQIMVPPVGVTGFVAGGV